VKNMNMNININDSENNSVVTNNEVNRSIDDNHANINNFLNNESVNISMTWYWEFNFPPAGRDANIIWFKL